MFNQLFNSTRLRMALIACTECGKQVSTEAKACPSRGFPVAEQAHNDPAAPKLATQVVVIVASNAQSVLLQVRPSWWNFVWHFLFFLLVVPLLIAFVPHSWWEFGWLLLFVWLVVLLLNALYRRHSFVMRIYSDPVSVVEGFWSKESTKVFIEDIRSIDVKQGIWGRLVNIGNVTIFTAAAVDAAEEAPGVPRPNKIKDLPISQRQQSTTWLLSALFSSLRCPMG